MAKLRVRLPCLLHMLCLPRMLCLLCKPATVSSCSSRPTYLLLAPSLPAPADPRLLGCPAFPVPLRLVQEYPGQWVPKSQVRQYLHSAGIRQATPPWKPRAAAVGWLAALPLPDFIVAAAVPAAGWCCRLHDKHCVLMVLRTLALPATSSWYCRDNSLMDYCGRSLDCTTLDGWAVYRNRSSQHNVSLVGLRGRW